MWPPPYPPCPAARASVATIPVNKTAAANRLRCEGVARRYDTGPRLVVDNDAFGGISRLVERIGDNHRDR